MLGGVHDECEREHLHSLSTGLQYGAWTLPTQVDPDPHWQTPLVELNVSPGLPQFSSSSIKMNTY